MNQPGQEAHAGGQDGAGSGTTDGAGSGNSTGPGGGPNTPASGTAPGRGTSATPGGEVRKPLDRAPGDRYRQPASFKAGPSRNRGLGAAVAVAVGTAVVTFALITFDIGPGLLVLGLAGGWLTGLALAGGAPAGKGVDAGRTRAAVAAVLGGGGIAAALLLDALRAYAIGGVLLPWEYALARFGVVAPLAIVLAAGAGWVRGR